MFHIQNYWLLRVITLETTDSKNNKSTNKFRNKWFNALYEKTEDPIVMLDKNFCVIDINHAFREKFGFEKSEIGGKNLKKVFKKAKKDFANKDMTNKLLNGVTVIREDTRYDNEGNSIECLIKRIPVIEEGELIGAYVIYNDITERKEEEKKIKYLSFHDQLTGLYNRRYFEDTIARLDRSRKLPIGIITADIDNLKQINDLYGHNIGDKYIKKTAKVIYSSVREEDIVSRIGGDEFAVVLPEVKRTDISNIKDRIQEKIKNINIEDINFSISIGFEIKTSDNQNINKIIRNSDKKMYQMKKKTKEENLKKKLSIIKNKKEFVFEEFPMAIMIADFKGKILEVNNKLSEMLGYSEKELKNMTHFDITREKDNKKNIKYLEKLRDKEINSYELDKKYIKKNGEFLDVHIKVKVITDHHGEPVCDFAFISNK